MNYGEESSVYGWDSLEPMEDHFYNLAAINELLPEGRLNILDVGCGNGYIASRLAAMGHKVTALDASEDGILLARKAYPDVRFEVHSAYDDLRPLVGQVDLVVSSEVIEHLYSPRQFLQNIHQVLKPGGHLILTTPYHGYLKNLALSLFNHWDKHFTVDWEGGHIKFFSERSLALMLDQHGFRYIVFNNAGRVRWLWKSMVCRAEKVG